MRKKIMRQNHYKVKKDDELNLNINVTTEEGNLKIALLDENNNELFIEGNPKEQVTKTIKINKDAAYRLKIDGKHKGSYKIAWDIKES